MIAAGSPREPRSDAARNHQALVRAAIAAVHREGPRVPMATIAAGAGVGIGTLYRHFPTREDLLGYLTHASFEQVLANARAAEDAATAAGALHRFIEAAISQRNELVLPLHGGPPTREATLAVREQVHQVIQRIIDRGRADGTITRDVTPRDIVVLGAMLAQPRQADPGWDATCLRLLATYLAGLGGGAPAVVAHEAASLHLLSGGRFELGIGAGWYQPEYEAAGIAFAPAGQRLARLDASLGIIRGLLAGTPVRHEDAAYRIDGLDLDVIPVPRQGSPRILVGAGGPRMLRLAARHADVVGILPAPIRDSADGDNPRDRLPAAFDAKVGVLREAAGDRFGDLELSAVATFVVTGRRRAATEDLISQRGWTGFSAEEVWQMPTVFIGSPDQVRADLRERQERFGLSYLVAGEDSQGALAEVIGGL